MDHWQWCRTMNHFGRSMKFCESNEIRTFEQFEEETNQIAAGLVAHGLKPGDRIGIWCQNKIEWIQNRAQL